MFTKKRAKNMGQLENYLFRDHHPAIISHELFRQVSPEMYHDVYGSDPSDMLSCDFI